MSTLFVTDFIILENGGNYRNLIIDRYNNFYSQFRPSNASITQYNIVRFWFFLFQGNE